MPPSIFHLPGEYGAQYGQRGKIVGWSDHYQWPTVLVKFKGGAYYCATSSLSFDNPSLRKRRRREERLRAATCRMDAAEVLGGIPENCGKPGLLDLLSTVVFIPPR